nr:MAG TPA: hypothetical protein [Caudoviricetes sp.]DAY68433.1 MAG TPA: hypothetical protein [Caudoviricetes sp.]
MSEFKFAYEKQDAQYVKRRIEIAVPVILPSDIMDEMNTVKQLTVKDDGKDTKKKSSGGGKETVQASSVIMIAIAVALAAITGNK